MVINEVTSAEDWLPPFLAVAGVPDVKEKLLKGYQAGSKTFKVHLDGYNLLPAFKGEAKEWPRKEFFYFRVMQILETVLEMNHALRVDGDIQSARGMLNRVLERALHLAKHDYLVGIISDFSGVDEQTKGTVTRLAAHNDVMALFIYDPLEARLPSLGKVVVSQGDLQLEVDTGDGQLRRRFSEQFEYRLKTARDLMLKRGIPVLAIHTADGVREQFMEFLGHRPMRLGG